VRRQLLTSGLPPSSRAGEDLRIGHGRGIRGMVSGCVETKRRSQPWNERPERQAQLHRKETCGTV